MKSSVMKKRFRAGTAVLVILMLILSVFPSNIWTNNGVEATDGDITIYFDTGACPDTAGSNGWKKDLSTVYYYLSNDADNSDDGKTSLNFTNTMQLTNIPSEFDETKGKVFKVTFNSSDYKYISFSPASGERKYFGRTARRADITLTNNMRIYNTENGWGGYQAVWYGKTVNPIVDFSGSKFKIANMTNEAVNFKLVYTNGVEEEDTIVTVSNVAARTYNTEQTVPSCTTGSNTPYNKVSIYRDGYDTPMKVYNLTAEDHKLLENTFYYGITEFKNDALDYGDKKTLCYWSTDFVPGNATTQKLYLEKTSFDAGQTITIKTSTKDYTVNAIGTDGNAAYVTAEEITVNAGEIFSIIYKENTYNLSWTDSSKNLVVISGNVADVSSTYSVQSTNNEYNGQKYITVKADMFDYQYDQFDYLYGDSNSNGSSHTSEKGNAKRPYLAVNTALSKSTYGTNTDYPMYLGQFWLPIDKEASYNTSQTAYTPATANNQRAGHNDDGESYWIQGEQESGFYPYFGFGEKLKNFHWAANLAYRTNDQKPGTYKPYDAVVQGLVANKLGTGSNANKLMDPSSTATIPYFDPSWWTGNVDATMKYNNSWSKTESIDKASYLKEYDNLAFPFFEIKASDISYKNGYSSDKMLTNTTKKYEGTYYLFDSLTHSVYVDPTNTTDPKLQITGNTGTQLVYDNYGDGKYTNSQPGFFPFNKTTESNSENLHYGFGAAFSVDFYLNENGTLDGEEDGIPVTFTFQGDDDVWVFLDDKLILDMGGAHKNAIGEINFNTKNTYIGAGDTITNNKDNVVSTGKNSISKSFDDLGIADNSDYLKVGKHKITMYYLERGMLNSNLYVMFNLPMSLTKWELQEDTDFSTVNQAFLAATKKVADSDVFNYTVSNKGTTSAKVVGSGFKAPTYSNVTRQNDEINNTSKNTTLSTGTTPQIQTISTPVTKPNRIYLDPMSGWNNDEAKFGALLKSSKGELLYAPAKWDEDVGKWYVDYNKNYKSTIKWLRLNPTKYPGDLIYNANTSNWDWIWNQATELSLSDFSSTKNTIIITDWNKSTWSSTVSQYNKTTKNYAEFYHTNNFSPGDEVIYYDVDKSATDGVTYKLTDKFTSDSVIYDTRKYSNTTNPNVVSLQYDEMATFSKQFAYGSSMKVTQLDTLSAPKDNSRTSEYDDTVTRSVSYYYNTYTKSTLNDDTSVRRVFAGIYDGEDVANTNFDHVETMYGTQNGTKYFVDDTKNKNYSADSIINLESEKDNHNNVVTTYNFSDPTDSTNEYVHLRQVIINEVKTADLTIQKTVLESDDITELNEKKYNFTITFVKIFGSDEGNSEFNASDVPVIYYDKNGDIQNAVTNLGDSGNENKMVGRFSLGIGERIEIKNIPVGTTYYITEEAGSSTDMYEFNEDASINIGSNNNPAELGVNTVALVVNKRKTGNIALKKEVYSVSDEKIENDTTEFTVKITFTSIPNGVKINDYGIKAGSNVINIQDKVAYVTVTAKDPLTLSGIPYGVKYTIEEENIPLGYTKLIETGETTNVSITHANGYDTNGLCTPSGESVIVKNKLTPITMPSTGGSPLIFLLPFGIIAILLSGVAVVIYKKKLNGEKLMINHRGGRYRK